MKALGSMGTTTPCPIFPTGSYWGIREHTVIPVDCNHAFPTKNQKDYLYFGF